MPKSAKAESLSSYLAAGYWREGGGVPHRFDGSVVTVNLKGLDAAGATMARAALDAWETVARISFKEVGGKAKITFDDAGSSASTSVMMTQGGRTIEAGVEIGQGWLSSYGTGVGSYSFHSYLHEVGHALGLGHPAQYNGSAAYATHAKFAEDSWQQSVMSYFNQYENTAVDASYAVSVTPMLADIAAIQMLYGAPKGGPTKGSTTYGVGADSGTYIDAFFAGGVSLRKNAMTIYDKNGTDTIDFSDDARAQVVSLEGGTVSDVYGLKGNLGIAQGTLIENYRAGSGNDAVTGNAAANLIAGGAGDDGLSAGDGNDRLEGGAGDDVLAGGAGADAFVFDGGQDVVADFVDNADTLVLHASLWGGGTASVAQALGMAEVVEGGVLFDFGGGATLLLAGLTRIDALADDLAFA